MLNAVDVEPDTDTKWRERAVSHEDSRKILHNDLVRLGIFSGSSVAEQKSSCYQTLLAVTTKHDA